MARELEHIKQYVNACVGKDVELTCSARRKTQHSRAVVVGAYSTVFTVRISDPSGYDRRISYTYVDLFTKAISIKLLA